MDEKLKKALDFANYNHTLFNQKKLAYQDFLDNCVHYCNAGKFTINRQLIAFVSGVTTKELILLDDNNVPVKITNVDAFSKEIKKIYATQLENYYKKYTELTSNKTVQGIINE